MRVSAAVFIVFLLSSCQKQNLNNARKSVTGSWIVTEIYSDQKDTSGVHHDGRHWESGGNGAFSFSDNNASWNYTRLDSVYQGTASWSLSREKVREGFHRVERYTLHIGSTDFNCMFGDATSDAEKNATRMVLSYETGTNDPDYVLTLEKN